MLFVAVTGDEVPANVMLQKISQANASGLLAGMVIVSVVPEFDPRKVMKFPAVPDKVVGKLVNVVPVLLAKASTNGTFAALVIVNVPSVTV